MSLYGGSKPPPYAQSPSIANRKSKKYILHSVSAGTSTRPPCTFSGRADNACTNLLGSFVRYVRSRGSMKLRRVAKPPTFIFYRAARTCHALLLATNSCTRKEIFKRMENPLK